MASSLFHVQLWLCTVRNGFRAERRESLGTLYVAKIKCKMESYCLVRVNRTTVLSYHSCQSTLPIISLDTSITRKLQKPPFYSCPDLYELQCILCSSTNHLPRERSCLFDEVAKPSCNNCEERCSLLWEESHSI